MYYNSIIVIPESEYNDILRYVLEPWKHYVPVKADLSNLKNTILWCNDNLDKMDIIKNNLIKLRDSIINIENMFALGYNKLNTNDNQESLQFKLTNGVFDTATQQTISGYETITDDTIVKLGKETTFQWKSRDNTIKREEQISYNKYLKYKRKYIKLKMATKSMVGGTGYGYGYGYGYGLISF